MQREHSTLTKVRFYLGTAMLYASTLSFGWYILQSPQQVAAMSSGSAIHDTAPTLQTTFKLKLIMGKPVRIVIPDSGIDLPVDQGDYNPNDGSWTLSTERAQYAMNSTLANNSMGNTLVYGHGTDAVFGKLGATAPAVGAEALIYTDNGHIFSYSFQSARDLTPADTSLFDYQGPAILTVQTCTGYFSEWRTMFQFGFNKVVQ
jgi:hypothetical protein